MSILLVSLSLHFQVFSFLFIFLFFELLCQSHFMDQLSHFFHKSETIVAKQILFLVWYCLETCVNRVANCVTQKFIHLRPKFDFFFLFLMSFYIDILGNFSTYHIPHYQNIFFQLNFLFCVLGSIVSKNMCKLRHKFKNAKNLPELTWSWQNLPWYMETNRKKVCVI